MAGTKKSFNKYKFIDDAVGEFYIQDGDTLHSVLVDRDDLERLIEFDQSWTLLKTKGLLYARTNIYGHDENGKYRLMESKVLHRWVAGLSKGDGFHVDHINHDGLDNRRDNLRVVPAAKNLVNRKSKNKNNKSGYRNVFWNKTDKRWVVSLHKNGKQIWGGQYKDVHEAGKVAAELRKKHYGEYSDAS